MTDSNRLIQGDLYSACSHRQFHAGVASGSVMDCHAMAQGSIPAGNGVLTELHVLRKGQ